MILRFRSKEGVFRIQIGDNDTLGSVSNEIQGRVSAPLESIQMSDKPNSKGGSLSSLFDKSVNELGFKNGDMLYLEYDNKKPDDITKSFEGLSTQSAMKSQDTSANQSIPITSSTGSIPISKIPTMNPKNNELPIDKKLDKEEGLIYRKKSNLCRHGDKGMCEYCSPLPPWDKGNLEKNGIKHTSFFAYLKEINDSKNNRNNSTSYIPPLDEPNYKINRSCKQGHLPYPKGICSKCQPPVITLQQQKFRMVDHVEFSDSSILNKFIDSWRLTGMQRFGYLYGKYDAFDKVPLGIKASVEFIYEPPQADESDGLTLLPWENEIQIDKLAEKFGLYKVGIIFTDLTDSGMKNGTVLCKRHKDSYFLSNLELIMAAKNQLSHPNITHYSNSGKFTSKFITCVVSGGTQGEIEPRSYQVSTSAEALVDADIITGCTQPSQVYINESNENRFVPDVFYSKINEYGLEVKSNAKPAFPIDYLLVTLLDSFPLEPKPLFRQGFAIENRDYLGDLQNLSNLYNHLNTDLGDGKVLFDFHLLAYLLNINILGENEVETLLKFINSGDREFYSQLIESPGWMTLITILEQSS